MEDDTDLRFCNTNSPNTDDRAGLGLLTSLQESWPKMLPSMNARARGHFDTHECMRAPSVMRIIPRKAPIEIGLI